MMAYIFHKVDPAVSKKEIKHENKNDQVTTAFSLIDKYTTDLKTDVFKCG